MWREKLLFNPSSMQLDCTETINGHRPKNGDLAVPMISVVLISGLLFSVRGKTCPGFPELSKLRQCITGVHPTPWDKWSDTDQICS